MRSLYSGRPAGKGREQRAGHPGVAIKRRIHRRGRRERREGKKKGRQHVSFPTVGRRCLKLFLFFFLSALSAVNLLRAEPPVASYLFPAGGRRGTTMDLHVGGLFLHKDACWDCSAPASRSRRRTWVRPSPSGSRGRCCRCQSRRPPKITQRHDRPRHDRQRRRSRHPPRPRLDLAGRRLRPRLCRRRSAGNRRAGN